VHDEKSERALEPRDDATQGLGQISAIAVFATDEKSGDFGVCLAREFFASVEKLGLQLVVVFDDSVVDECELAAVAEVRMRVHICRTAVRRPARVTDARRTVCDTDSGEIVGEDAELSCSLSGFHVAVAIDDGDAGRVVSAVLESAEAPHEHLDALAGSDVAHDSTHGPNSTGALSRAARGGRPAAKLVGMTEPAPSNGHVTPFVEIDRATWAELAPSTKLPLTETELVQLRGLGDLLDMREVSEVYLPLSRLLNLYVAGARQLHRETSSFLGERYRSTPFVIGVAGSVAVGKSTIARLLRELLARWDDTPRVELVTTDGFLLPNAELERRGIMDRKGFPESYDRRALLRFVSKVKSGAQEVRAPFYSHLSYDVIPDAEIVVRAPDVLIVEGLNVLQPPGPGSRLAVSDLFDFTVYVDARTHDIARWYEERFLALQRGAFSNPKSYFHRYASLTEEQARAKAHDIWTSINEPNLLRNILPTRARASRGLRKDSNHAVSNVLLRKI
jgi:type I pantothenate kinase